MGPWVQPRCSSGDNAFPDCTATSVAPGAGTPGRNQLVCDGVFLCGRSGHGVNRCSRVDTSFPFVPRVGRLISWMASTGQYGPVGPWRCLRREKRDGLGGRVSLPDH